MTEEKKEQIIRELKSISDSNDQLIAAGLILFVLFCEAASKGKQYAQY